MSTEAVAISSNSSADSLDVLDLIARTEATLGDASLLAESLGSDTESSRSSFTLDNSPVPPFPSECKSPITVFLDMNAPLPLQSTPRRQKASGADDDVCPVRALIAAPTPPRMKRLVNESICIQKWTENVASAGLERTRAPRNPPPNRPWIAEGSLWSQEELEASLVRTRVRTRDRSLSASTDSRSSPMRTRAARTLEALVFSRELDLDADGDGQRKRFSLQVSARDMSPEMVDMVLRLQDLNTYFKQDERSEAGTAASPPIPQVNIIPPQSTSVPDLSLAARRGKAAPPGLSLPPPPSQAAADGDFPFPSPFLGSPSTWSPKFEYATNKHEQFEEEQVTMDLEDMIASLRQRCAALPGACTPDAEDGHETFSLSREPSPLKCSTARKDGAEERSVWSDDEDDWAFAEEIMHDFPPASSSSAAILPADSSLPDDYRPPSSPLPELPSIPQLKEAIPSCLSSGGKKMRGILKGAKSVRFASLPTGDEPAPASSSDEDAPAAPRMPTRPLAPPLRRKVTRKPPPSPLRNSFAPEDVEYPPADASSPAAYTPEPATPRVAFMAPARPASQAASLSRARMARRSDPGPLALANVPVVKSAPAAADVKALVHKPSAGDKENARPRPHARASTSGAPVQVAPWHKVDENVLRRKSAGGASQKGSRMPVPLKNLFGRFK